MKFTLPLLMLCVTAIAQDKQFFHRNFQEPSEKPTENVRSYTQQENKIILEDHVNGQLQEKVEIVNAESRRQADEFFWFVISNGWDLNYKSYFEQMAGVFDFFSEEKISKRLLVRGKKIRTAQVWNAQGLEFLVNGSGQASIKDDDSTMLIETYRDSVLIMSYSVREMQGDTIFNVFDRAAEPRGGIKGFYKQLASNVHYPGAAWFAGAQGRIYVQFVVDKDGRLTEFKPLTNEGFNFEKKTIKKLEQLPPWTPAVYGGKPVKSMFTLPIIFKMHK